MFKTAAASWSKLLLVGLLLFALSCHSLLGLLLRVGLRVFVSLYFTARPIWAVLWVWGDPNGGGRFLLLDQWTKCDVAAYHCPERGSGARSRD